MSQKPKRALPVVPAPTRSAVPCLTCGLCCTYLAVEISAPDSVRAATEILWHLYHEGVSIYRDSDDEWMVQFETRCKHLAADNKCAISEQRPQICRDYAADTCEVNADDERFRQRDVAAQGSRSTCRRRSLIDPCTRSEDRSHRRRCRSWWP